MKWCFVRAPESYENREMDDLGAGLAPQPIDPQPLLTSRHVPISAESGASYGQDCKFIEVD